MTNTVPAQQIADVRAFNRRYTEAFGFLNDRLDDSRFPLTDARLLYEIAHGDGLTAAEIERRLGMDKAQISRSLGRLTREGLVRALPAPHHARHKVLRLTNAGVDAFADLNGQTQAAIGRRLGQLDALQRDRLIHGMAAVTAALSPAGERQVAFRDLAVGDIGWIAHRQARLYFEEYGWDWTYESLIARIMADFADHFDPGRDAAWVAEVDGRTMGSIFLVRSDTPGVAKLRLLYVEPAARGLGIGRELVARCIAAARSKGYDRLELWTNSVLVAARRIYEAAGFVLVEENPHRSFGHGLIGQTWSLDL